jgi:rare lipoprotein A (peptidoglycan hydrolase)
MLKERLSRRAFLVASAAFASNIANKGVSFAEENYPDEGLRGILTDRGVDSVASEPEEPEIVCSGSWEGTCTYYSHAGCVGCSPGQIMANGEPFREWGMTIAFMELPLNTQVRVTNLDNGRSVIARVTDRGGFWKYGILADLSLGVSTTLGNKSRASRIKISTLDCE